MSDTRPTVWAIPLLLSRAFGRLARHSSHCVGDLSIAESRVRSLGTSPVPLSERYLLLSRAFGLLAPDRHQKTLLVLRAPAPGITRPPRPRPIAFPRHLSASSPLHIVVCHHAPCFLGRYCTQRPRYRKQVVPSPIFADRFWPTLPLFKALVSTSFFYSLVAFLRHLSDHLWSNNKSPPRPNSESPNPRRADPPTIQGAPPCSFLSSPSSPLERPLTDRQPSTFDRPSHYLRPSFPPLFLYSPRLPSTHAKNRRPTVPPPYLVDSPTVWALDPAVFFPLPPSPPCFT